MLKWKFPIKTTENQDMLFLAAGLLLLFNGHIALAWSVVIFHILFVEPKEPGRWMRRR